MIDFNTPTGAIFSDCKQYRFLLWRTWNNTLPKILVIGLNPSTANEHTNDATIRKVQSIAKILGYGGLVMGNCFPFIVTNPKMLNNYQQITQNDGWLQLAKRQVQCCVFAWGNFAAVKEQGRDAAMHRLFKKAMVFNTNKNGTPRHPLYLPLDTTLKIYKPLHNLALV